MTEPTAEQVAMDRERARAQRVLDESKGWCGCNSCVEIIAVALRDRAIEAHAAFEQALAAKAGDTVAGYFLVRKAVSNGCFGWWVSGPGIGAEGFISLPNLIAAIRALRGLG